MGHYMSTTLYHLFPYEISHMIDLCLWEEPLIWEEFFYELPFWRVIHFNLDDSLEIGASHGNEGSLHFSYLSLQFLEDKKHLGGEDCNIPKLACS